MAVCDIYSMDVLSIKKSATASTLAIQYMTIIKHTWENPFTIEIKTYCSPKCPKVPIKRKTEN